MDDEFAFHFAEKIAALQRNGLSAEEAHEEAVRQFGDPATARDRIVSEDWRGERISRWRRIVDDLARDSKHALRSLRRAPGFSVVAIVVLAIGIGANTAIFSVVNAVLLKPIPFDDPDTLVAVENTSNGAPYGPWASPVKYTHWRAQTELFADVAAIDPYPRFLPYTGGEAPERVTVSRASESYFRVVRARFAQGRPFTPDEDKPGGPALAVISYDFWQRRLGGTDAIGDNLTLGGGSYTIVGILSRDFRDVNPYFDASSFGADADVLVPFQLDPNSTDEGNGFVNIARLRPGVTLAQARAGVKASVAAFRERFPRSMPEGEGFSVLSAQEAITTMLGDPRTRLWVLLGAVTFVLLIACANVANLLLVRATGRSREIAIRSTLGAGRGRILRLLLTESLLLSLAGGLLGLVVGSVGIRALLSVNTAGLPRLGAGISWMGMDWRILMFALVLSLVTSVVFGLVPALVGSRTDLNRIIKGSDSRSGGFRQNKTRSALVAVEIGLAVVLVIGAALLIRTSSALGRVDLGFDPSRVLTMHTILSGPRFATASTAAQTVRGALESVRAMPGVENAGVTSYLPPGGAPSLPFKIVDGSDGASPSTGSSYYVPSSDGYFATMGIPLIRGRTFTSQDENGPPVAVISESMAERFWPAGRDPLNDSVSLVDAGLEVIQGSPERRVVGIVGDVHYGGVDRDPRPTVHVPMAQLSAPEYAFLVQTGAPTTWVVRTRDDTVRLATDVRDSIREETQAPVVDVMPMARVLSSAVSSQRLNMLLMSAFGASALLLAAVGIYGVMAYSVEHRVKEIGIRMALGSDARQVARMFMQQGVVIVGVGVVLGLAAAFYMASLLESFLFGVNARDPLVFVTVPVVLLVIGLAAIWIPASRATRVTPLAALRYE